MESDPQLLIGVSGHDEHVAELITALREHAVVRVIAHGSCKAQLADALPGLTILGDEDEWYQWQKVGDPVMHIDLVRWADALLVAPMTAHVLAQAAHGLCSDLLTSVVRAWDPVKPWAGAPAMGPGMWRHPHTATHMAALRQLGCTLILPPPEEAADAMPAAPTEGPESGGRRICMAAIGDIVAAVRTMLPSNA